MRIMKVTVKILKGTSAGKEVRLPMPKCLIGRSDECHMRPKSDAVSRRHCVIYLRDGKIWIRDLKSRNGTAVNGESITADCELRSGDRVQVGPLAFEMIVDHSLGGEKRPKVTGIADAAARTKASGQEASAGIDDGDISDWLDEADELDRARRLSDPETRQLKLDETDQVKLQRAIEERAAGAADGQDEEPTKTEMVAATDETRPTEKSKKKTLGKLPRAPEKVAKDSREAAADMLKKFFNKR
jgi:predicted component of type VI protein secretion system